jgi:uncharacterized membrane protein YgdD (TMEM256/DUF423 family)
MRGWLTAATILAALAVLTGAFGAHGLRQVLTERELEIYRTGAHYHLAHALGLAVLAVWADGRATPSRWTRAAAWLFAAGIVLFSGSLYVLAASGVGALGAITPFGGISFVAAWCCFGVGALRAGH